ncbi:hypothetical protein BKA70DRAFT_1569310 [Coprinopsis sp. MPI-PUGE-AT-0042]|nr:hypothetical protein BKA70DRAFT_1569310 [Coprinopsis sp. MPI-PUGE-AT-0042]
MGDFSLPRRPGRLSTPPEMMEQSEILDGHFPSCILEADDPVQPPREPFERKEVQSKKLRRHMRKAAKKGSADLVPVPVDAPDGPSVPNDLDEPFQPQAPNAQPEHKAQSSKTYSLLPPPSAYPDHHMHQENPLNVLASSLPPSLIHLARERRARGASRVETGFSSSQTITVKASGAPANQTPSKSDSPYPTAGASCSTTTTTTTWAAWTAPIVPVDNLDQEVVSDSRKQSDSCLGSRIEEVNTISSSVRLPSTNSGNSANDSVSFLEGEKGKQEATQSASLSASYSRELEEFKLERRCAMIAKLYVTLGKMEIKLEKRIFQLRTASRTVTTGRVKADLIMPESVERGESQLRQEHADAVQRLRPEMEREFEEEVKDYIQKTASSKLSNSPEAGKEISEPSQQASDQGLGTNITHTDLNPSDSDAANGALQSSPAISIEKLEEMLRNQHPFGQVAAPEVWQQSSMQSLPTAQRINAPEIPLDAGKSNIPSTASSISLSKSEGRQPILQSQPQPITSARNFSPADPSLLHVQVEPYLDHDTLGIPHNHIPVVPHASKSGGSVPEPNRSGKLAQAQALVNTPEPGKSTFHGTDNVEVSGGSFVAASTVINNTYYISHFHNAPLPRATSSNGTARQRSMEL